MKTKKIFLISTAVFLVVLMSSATSLAVLDPWTEVFPGRHDYITYYYLELGEGFWADYAGEMIEFQLGFSLGDSEIIAWGDADGIADWEGNYFGGDYTKLSFIFFKILGIMYHL